MKLDELRRILSGRDIKFIETWQHRKNSRAVVDTDCLLLNKDRISVIIVQDYGDFTVEYDAFEYLKTNFIKYSTSLKRIDKISESFGVNFNNYYEPRFFINDVPKKNLLAAVQFVANASQYFINSILDKK